MNLHLNHYSSINIWGPYNTSLSNQIQLFLKNDYPLIIQYNVAALGEIKLCLAPQGGTN